MEKSKEDIIREIYWIFRNAIHNGHIEIKKVDGITKTFKPLPNSPFCYVCELLNNLEHEIAKVFGEENYYECPKIKEEKKGKKIDFNREILRNFIEQYPDMAELYERLLRGEMCVDEFSVHVYDNMTSDLEFLIKLIRELEGKI